LGYGDDLVVQEIGEASIGLTGGTGCMAIGTCGALVGAAMAVSFSFGFGRKDIEGNMARMFAVNNAVS